MATGKVIVVGAGMAGLAAAYRLRNAGADVTVVESSDHVGGRLVTDSRDGYLIERGAQLITSTYRNALGLVKELGLEAQLKPTSPWMAIVKDGGRAACPRARCSRCTRSRRASSVCPISRGSSGTRPS